YSHASINQDRICFICEDQAYTYREVLEQVNRTAKSLYALGIRPGDHVAVSLYNNPIYYFLIFALAKLGTVKIPINMQLEDEEKRYIIKHSDTNWMIGIQIPELPSENFPFLRGTINLNDWEIFLAMGDSVEESVIMLLEEKYRNPYEVSDILYTSGSTSFPKGVTLTHDALLRTSYATCRTRLMEEGRRILVPIPFYHIFAYSEGILASIHVGGSIVFSNRRFDADNYLNLMHRHHVNDVICVPLIAIQMIESGNVQAEDYPDLHALFISPAGPDWLWQAVRKAFGVADVTTGYGMTECGATTTILSPQAPAEWIRQYTGKLKDAAAAGIHSAYPYLLELKICDPNTGEEILTGQTGEILCRGLTVTPGYYKNEEANQAAFQEDGWFRTGDLGALSENGLLAFHGRKNDMYKINGENVSPHNLEIIISQCPEVENVEIVGIPHEKYGEIGVAFIDANDPDDDKKRAIEDYCREHLARFQIPKYFIYESRENWPRTSTNKVQKGKLRERALRNLQADLQ
ncbi:MAG: acyl--CoA ligase, partial [Clostridiales bacterium]|nr:acyl--CoA ligase [Clostridiales bacterium]